MKRRTLLSSGCAMCAVLAASRSFAQAGWQPPARFARPEIGSDEGGLWALMDREERRLRSSPFRVRNAELNAYVTGVACRLAGDHCPDLRVMVIHTPLFNATMAPNGMMQVWTGLLLRLQNEAQLAAILGHEIGHYLARHAVERLRDLKSGAAIGQFLGLFGLAGAIGQLALVAGLFAYSREQERDADRIGCTLMAKAGYDAREAPRVWSNLLLELRARADADPEHSSVLFATHPDPEDRQLELSAFAATLKGGAREEAAWDRTMAPHRRAWLTDEVKRGRHKESIALITRLMSEQPGLPEFAHARGEVHRMHGNLEAALADYRAAVALGSEPPETHRGMGLVFKARGQFPDAKASFQRYLDIAPNAADAPMIRSYMEEIGT